ncbi:cytochrome P450 4C1-like isoform X2 [Ischnura elegans]|uniref:cytochrome P450 4C1-like isoform X2 n=1 Tax=Ischnura elegans TaxID=197161 RepID=UPI001ED8912F|nr:cytochrome P450 4C1-like isoform X2 [Ischnura elegans]
MELSSSTAIIAFSAVCAVVIPLILIIWPVLNSYLSIRGRRVRQLINKIPGPPFLPVLGNVFEFLGSRERIVEVRNNHFASYSDIFKIWICHYPLVKPVGPECVEVGDKWFTHRKLLTPAFHFKILEEFIPLFLEKSLSLVDKLRIEAASGKSFDVVPIISMCTLDLICESAMGVKLNPKDKSQQEYVAAIYTLGDIVYYRSMRPWLFSDFMFSFTKKSKQQEKALKVLHEFTESAIREKKNLYLLRKNNDNENSRDFDESDSEEQLKIRKKRKVKAFLDLLIELSVEKKVLTDREIREEVDTFMFEGHDTTSMAICWILFTLANNPDVQEKAWKEVKEFWEYRTKMEKEDRSYQSNIFTDMPYLERCIKESLRLYPSVPVISRKLSEDLQMGGYLIPADTIIHIHVSNIHRNPSIYSNPDSFDPDRFLPEAVNTRHPYAYIPFSAGPRNCIGQRFAMLEVKAVVSAILFNFHLVAMDRPEDIVIVADLVLRSKNGIKMKFIPRNGN